MDWLVDGVIGRWKDWLTGRLVDVLAGRWKSWLLDWLVDKWMLDGLVGRSARFERERGGATQMS